MILVTGCAGFIGFHLTRRLLAEGRAVAGLDNLSDYYDVRLKEARLKLLQENPAFRFHRTDLADAAATAAVFAQERPEMVVHLAAQVGVRHSVSHPHAYIESNVTGFLNILEGCRHHGVKHLVFASSSSVYGLNAPLPCSEHQPADHPVSLYGATKRANELMAHSYSHLFGLPATGLRFFTVYGPWGRPDMALFTFTRAILEEKSIDVFNGGLMKRDFTYIDDVVEGVVRVLGRIPATRPDRAANPADPAASSAPFRLYNLGNHAPVGLLRVIELLEQNLGRRADKRLLPAQAGEMLDTGADVADFARDTGFSPATPIEEGVRRFVEWYRLYHAS